MYVAYQMLFSQLETFSFSHNVIHESAQQLYVAIGGYKYCINSLACMHDIDFPFYQIRCVNNIQHLGICIYLLNFKSVTQKPRELLLVQEWLADGFKILIVCICSSIMKTFLLVFLAYTISQSNGANGFCGRCM